VNKVILIGNLGADPEVRRTLDWRSIRTPRSGTVRPAHPVAGGPSADISS